MRVFLLKTSELLTIESYIPTIQRYLWLRRPQVFAELKNNFRNAFVVFNRR